MYLSGPQHFVEAVTDQKKLLYNFYTCMYHIPFCINNYCGVNITVKNTTVVNDVDYLSNQHNLHKLLYFHVVVLYIRNIYKKYLI
jgi:hypothetical protein